MFLNYCSTNCLIVKLRMHNAN
ncbi:hypothetical protein F383_10287 [Gossypium arboreum]|uniref:Uncharacterized protein n=1 Tax=Gossypium arboreum TaxID=29729 RepID=A0A0B0MW53_GOSAR|nr:hypothetical protein F383_10287 [Gossypium arboreum]